MARGTGRASVPKQLVDAGVPEQFATQFASGEGSALNDLAQVGDLGATILAQVPEEARPLVEPMIPAIVDGIHTAFSIATGATFMVGIFTALLAAVLVVVLLPGRRMGEESEPTEALDRGSAPLPAAD